MKHFWSMWWIQMKAGLSVIALGFAFFIPLAVFAYLMLLVVLSNLHPLVQAVLLPIILIVAVSVFALLLTVYDTMF